MSGIVTLKVEAAEAFAAKAHAGQERLDGTPFIEHPRAIMHLMLESPWWFTENELCAGWLHDVLEDTDVPFGEIRAAFGDYTAAIVEQLTKKEHEKYRRQRYFIGLRAAAPVVICIKLLDMYHNLLSLDGGRIGVDEDFKKQFVKKVREYGLPYIGVIKMFGDTWRPFADWMEDKMSGALAKHGLVP